MKSYQTRFSTLVYSVFKLLILLWIPVLFFSCKKDIDQEAPRVIIESPYENQTFSTVDTILVSTDITDNEQVKSLTISLLSDDYSPLGQSDTYAVSGSSVNFTIDFLIDQPFLESGTYFLSVRASDGENTKSAFVQLQLQAIPRQIERFLTVTKTEMAASVFSGVNFMDQDVKLQLDMDCKGAALNYRQNIFGITGGEIGDASFYKTTNFTLQSSIPNYGGSSLEYFFGLNFSPETENFILLQRDPQYRVLDKYGLPIASQSLQVGYLPQISFQSGDRIFVEQVLISSPSRILGSYTSQGLIVNTYSVDGPVRLVAPKTIEEDFVWIDSPSGTKLVVVDESDNLMEPIYSRANEALLAACEISEGVFLISTSTGIYRFSYNTGNTVVINQGLHPNQLVYEPMDGLIFAIEGNTVNKLSALGDLINSTAFTEPIIFFGIDYNR